MSAALSMERISFNGFKPRHEGSESRGLARAFVQRIDTNHETAMRAMISAVCVAKEGFRNGAGLRTPTYAISIQREWNLVPVFGSIVRSVERTKRSLTITEVRIASAQMQVRAWEATAEHGLSLVLVKIEVDKAGVRIENREIAFLGWHALVRRMQRSFDLSDAAVVKDIAEIFKMQRTLLEQKDTKVAIETGSGVWLGERVYEVSQQRVLLRIQTFVGELYSDEEKDLNE